MQIEKNPCQPPYAAIRSADMRRDQVGYKTVAVEITILREGPQAKHHTKYVAVCEATFTKVRTV